MSSLKATPRVLRLKDEAISLWHDGLDTNDIAERLNISEAWVYRILARYREDQIAAGLNDRGGA